MIVRDNADGWLREPGMDALHPSLGAIMIKVIPVTCSIVNWDEFLNWASTTSHPITESLDKAKMRLDNAGFIVSLAELKEKVEDPVKVLREADSLLKHLFYGFLVIASQDVIRLLSEESSLSIHSGNTKEPMLRLAVVSGSLRKWKEFIISCSHEQTDYGLRMLANQVQVIFERSGLGELFATLQKQKLPDLTFKLTEK